MYVIMKPTPIFSFVFFIIFMANLTGVEDLFNEGTCNWICTVDTANGTGEALRDTLAKGGLIKLEIMYEEHVDSGKCANQTELNTNSTATVLLKRATDHEAKMSQGSMAFFTQMILGNIYSGQFFIGGYRDIKVSCIFRQTSVTNSAMNFTNQRLTFHTPQSILYYVENLANYTKSNSTFLTLVRVERQIRVYVVDAGTIGNSSLASAKDNELLTFSDGWLFVAVIIWIVFVLYSPSIFLLFRPSKVKLQLPQASCSFLKLPFQATDDSGGCIEPEIRDGHVPPTEQEDEVNNTNPSARDNYPSSNEGINGVTNIEEGACGFSLSDRSQETFGVSSYEETTIIKPTDRDSKMVGAFHADRRPSSVPLGQESKHGNLTMFGPTRDVNRYLGDTNGTYFGSHNAATANEGQTKRNCLQKRSSVSSSSKETTRTLTYDGLPPDAGDTEPISRPGVISDAESPSSDIESASDRAYTADLSIPKRINEEPSDGNNAAVEQVTTDITKPNHLETPSTSASDGRLRAAEYTAKSTTQADAISANSPSSDTASGSDAASATDSSVAQRTDEELSSSDESNAGSTVVADVGPHVIEIREPNGLEHSSLGRKIAQRTSNVQPASEQDTSETEHTNFIIVGDTNPLGVGSFIGNILFSSANRNKSVCKMVKLIFIFTVPLLFTGFGDLLLIMLPSLSVRLSVHLPFPFLTTSVVNSVLENHPAVLFLVVFSALCYIFRLICVCFHASDTSENTLVPCSLHTKHFTCFVFETFKSVVSQFPKSLCNLKTLCSPCLRKHMICTACHACYEHCETLCISLSPCDSCMETAGECSEYLDVPQNILHNLEKQPSIVIKYWDSFVECINSSNKTNRFIWCVKVLFCPLAVVPFLIDVFFSSPLVCLCHGRQRILKERFKNKFKVSELILPIIEIFLTLFSLVWLVLFLVGSAVPLGVVIVGLIKTLATHTNKILPELVLVIFSFHYFWSCYRSFTTLYYDLVKLLASTYQKKFDEQEKKQGMNALIHYKQGRQKVLPEDLFNDACKDLNLPFRNQAALLFVKLGFTLLVFLFVWPIISNEAVMNMGDGVVTTVTFFAVAYNLINNAINGNKLEVSQEDAEKVVNDYIKKKQDWKVSVQQSIQ